MEIKLDLERDTKVGCKFCGNLIEPCFERAGVEYTTIVVGEKDKINAQQKYFVKNILRLLVFHLSSLMENKLVDSLRPLNYF